MTQHPLMVDVGECKFVLPKKQQNIEDIQQSQAADITCVYGLESLDDPTKGPGNFYLIDTVVETQGSDIDLRFFLSKGDAKHQLEGTNTEQTQ